MNPAFRFLMSRRPQHSLWTLLLIGLLSGLFSHSVSAKIQASVDRNPVAVGESFQLTLSADEEPDDNPDLAPLMIDFEVQGQQRSSNASWINGKASRNEQWIIRLVAKHSGDVLIPPLAFGQDSSPALHIKVTEQAQSDPQATSELFLEVEATPSKPYAQSQVIYTVRLYRSIELLSAQLNDPELKDAIVEKLGEDAQYSKLVNGIDYQVIERKYAIFPQQAGNQSISALNLKAQVLSHRQQPGFNGFFSRPQTEQKQISSKTVTLDVRPIPSEFTADNWLSAEALRLEDDWSNNGLQVQVGEPLTRTLRISAQGTTVAQLPELSSPVSLDGLKSYPDQPVLSENKQPDGLNAVREEKIAFIASKPGQYQLPGRSIKWFNLAKQRVETVEIAPVTIMVIGTADSPAPSSNDQPVKPTLSNNNPQPTITTTDESAIRLWQAISALLAFAWIATLVWVWRLRKTPADNSTSKNQSAPVQKADKTIKRLKAACIANQAPAAKQALLQWAQQNYEVDNLTSLAALSSPELAGHIQRLNQQLYAQQPGTWDGYPLWSCFAKQLTDASKVKKNRLDDDLEPLHKL